MPETRRLDLRIPLVAALLSAATITPLTASADECPQVLAGRALDVSAPTRVVLLPAERPKGTMALSLDTPDGQHHQVVWQAGRVGATSREVQLEAGCWQVSWQHGPPREGKAWETEQAWQPADSCAAKADPKLQKTLLGCAVFRAPRGTTSARDTSAMVPLIALRAPRVGLGEAAGRWRELWSGPGLSRHVEAKKTTARKVVTRRASSLVDNLSSMVMLKAQDKAMDLARERIQKALRCDKKPPFPQTCATLDTVRLADLLIIGGTLRENLFGDLISYAREALVKQLKLSAVPAQVLGTGLDVAATFARKGSKPTDREVAGAFVALTATYADAMIKDPAAQKDPVAQGAALAFAIMAECARQRDCSGKRMHAMITRPQSFFELPEGFALKPAWWPERELIKLIGKGLAIMRPTRQDNATERALAMSEVTFALLSRHVCADRGATSLSQCKDAKAKDWKRVESARYLVEGAILRDPQRGLVALNEILATREQERRMMAALGSFIIQTPTDAARGVAGQGQAMMQARQQSMERLVESLTTRKARNGDLIFGVHGSTSLSLSLATRDFADAAIDPNATPDPNADPDAVADEAAAFVLADSAGDVFVRPLSLTFGLSAQKYFGKRIGGSLAIDLLDLGAFASFKDGALDGFELGRALAPTLTLSVLFGDPDLPVFVGVRGGYLPAEEVAFVGANIGVYVPLLDFN